MYGKKMVKITYFNDIVKQNIVKIDEMFKKAYSLDIKP